MNDILSDLLGGFAILRLVLGLFNDFFCLLNF